jgi:hypothetical protein
MDKAVSKRLIAGPVAVFGILMAAQLACTIFSVDVKVGTTPPAEIIAMTEKAKTTPKAGETAAVNQTQPEATKEAATGGGSDFACFGTLVNGVTCLTAEGWKTFTKDNSDLKDESPQDMAACPDGKIYAGTLIEMAVFDGTKWVSLPVAGEEYRGAKFIACGPDGSIWTRDYDGISQYKNGGWKSFANTEFDTGEYSSLIMGLEVAPDGTVWAANGSSVSSYDGSAWKEYKQGSGFDNAIDPIGLTVDSKNRVWMVTYDQAYLFENGEWKAFKMGDIPSPTSTTVDPTDQLWLNTSEGIAIFDGKTWKSLSYHNGDIHSNGVNVAVFDKSGRTWLGMAYGIDVQVNGAWTHFRMDNADLAENEIITLAVVGNPALPEALKKQPGSIVGSIRRGGAPMANADMEVCVERISMTYYGDTPCSNQPFMKKTTTDADGKFSLPDLPVGYYVLTVKVDEGWAMLGMLGSDRIPVEEGKETDLGDLKVEVD